MEAKAREHESSVGRSSGKTALQHAISAAECYMKAARTASTPADRARLKRKCEELIALAERLKGPTPGPSNTPQQSRQLPTAEKMILLRSSKLHGSIFPPWESAPGDDIFARASGEEALFSDATPLPFSDKQRQIFAGWKRPHELFLPGPSSPAGEALPESLMISGDDCDLVQDITTDCSVVASLCAAMKHMGPHQGSMLASVMYPFDAARGRPALSGNGKYVFRMHFNGCFRQVVVDDRLPASSTARTLFVVDRRNPRLIWPALLEKAYLKVRGGYDFPGSNSGTDLWILTGWVPEQIFLQSDDIELDETWDRIRKAYDYGDVVVTLGTGRLSPEEEETLGLAGEHDYAMLGLKLDKGVRKMLLKNPWCDGLVWRGVGSSSLADARRPASPSDALKALTLADADPDPAHLTGAFWIAFEDVVQNFESLYLNWNPALFTHRQDHHFAWSPPSRAMALSFAHNPQYSLRAAADGAVWVLVSRHFQDAELALARNRTSTLAAVSSSLGFTALYVFAAAGARVELPDHPRSAHHHGPFVDSPQTLLRFDARAAVPYTVALAQSGLPLPAYAFTLSFFSRGPLTVARAPDERRHYQELHGAWTRRSAGGSAAAPTFVRNPQYRLAIARPTPVSLLLCADDETVPVRVDLVWSAARVAAGLATRDVVASSGPYRRGCCRAAAASLQPGVYALVLSTFEPGQLAAYTLRVGSDEPVDLAPLPADGAGRLRTPLGPVPPAPAPARDAGPRRLRAALRPSRLTRLGVAVRPAAAAGERPAAGPAVRLALELGTGPRAAVLAVSGDGEHADAALGLRTGDVDVDPDETARRGGLWVVLELVGGGGGAEGWGVRVDVWSDNPVHVSGGWESVDD